MSQAVAASSGAQAASSAAGVAFSASTATLLSVIDSPVKTPGKRSADEAELTGNLAESAVPPPEVPNTATEARTLMEVEGDDGSK